ncbi:MAG TPA: PD-(D/E)XK nuclease-like domain-containing protein [bacterium]|nr:PD-(D/E)XK nuclease-like domain-containing protein [bacterium]
MKPKIYFDLSDDEYFKIDAMNKSSLEIIKRSPAHFSAKVNEQTKAMAFGTAAHMAILQRDVFEKRYARLPDVDGRTKEFKEASFKILQEGREPLSFDDYNKIIGMSESVSKNTTARALLFGGNPEATMVWDLNGQLCKARVDYLTDNMMVDIKTCSDARDFERDSYKYGYMRQAAWYSLGFKALKGFEPDGFVFIALEKEPPFEMMFYAYDEDVISLYQKEMINLLDNYLKDKTRGYNHDIQKLGLPKWAEKIKEEY